VWAHFQKPMTAFKGVRSSWDMLARNSLFSRLVSCMRILLLQVVAPATDLVLCLSLGDIANHQDGDRGIYGVSLDPVFSAGV
jgi:hypothetical protein